jgi:muramidase (phage lysozyme)
MAVISIEQAGSKNRIAFLDMIAVSEIGKQLLSVSDEGYNVLVGATPSVPLLFDSYKDHPNIYNRPTNSTAAGRYQILYRYWNYYKKFLNLPDFSPLSQDLYALQQLKERKALVLIDNGDLENAIKAASNIWASFPNAGYGQNEHSLETLTKAFIDAGGILKV